MHRSAGRVPRGVKVVGHLGLAVDRDRMARGAGEIDAEHLVVEGDQRAVMADALALQTVGDARLAQKLDQPALQHARADTQQNMRAGALFQDHVVDAMPRQKLTEEQPRGTAADDRDLRFHASVRKPVHAAIARARHRCVCRLAMPVSSPVRTVHLRLTIPCRSAKAMAKRRLAHVRWPVTLGIPPLRALARGAKPGVRRGRSDGGFLGKTRFMTRFSGPMRTAARPS